MSLSSVGTRSMPDTPESQPERDLAWKLLQQYARWWEPGYAKAILHGAERVPEPIFYRIHIAGITGRRASLEPAAPADTELLDDRRGRRR